ncbi:MAG: VWA domain-containing protein [Pseudomonadota bacterium]
MDQELLEQYRSQLKCSFEQLDDTFEDCMLEAFTSLSDQGIKDYLKGASLVCMIGRGFEPVLVYLEEMPQVAKLLGEESLSLVSQSVWGLSRTPNGNSIPPFLNSIAEAARRLGSIELFQKYIDLLFDLAERTTGSIHGHHTTFPSPGLPVLLANAPYLLNQLCLEGLQNWVNYGIRNYPDHPERQENYFSLQSADSKAILQRERHGTLFIDNERKLSLYLKALWDEKLYMIPYSTGFDELRKPIPYYDNLGVRVPDVLDDSNNAEGNCISGIDRYRAILAHFMGHKRWSNAIIADNLSPFQRIAVEVLEDSRVEYLAYQIYPGLQKIFLGLHPKPIEDDCIMEQESCIRHRLTMLSYAILNPAHDYKNADIIEFSQRFHDEMKVSDGDTFSMSKIATSFIARTRRQTDQLAKMYFKDTEVEYRDDNRHLWKFIEMGDEEEMFDQQESKAQENEEEDKGLPPRHYHEWDYSSKSYRPDWVSLYETLHPPGNPQDIDDILDKHRVLARQLKQLLDLLKPQHYVRIRYQEDGSELDLDTAIRSLIDYKSGANPDPRINMSHKHDGRDIAVMLLLDLSESLNETPAGCEQSLLQLSQEAVALLSYAIEHLGDKFAIAGFSSNTRHEVRYQHIKGYSEHFDDDVKARLAAMGAGYSTRMGAALRHAGHYLGSQQCDKKLLLVLTDGEPADIDVGDPKLLIQDARKAVQELNQEGIYSYCINLDPHADEYVQDIFGKQYMVIDKVNQLPEKLPKLFMSLTG